MLESGLFFTLGFLAAALLALMIAPAVWRRAVVLTRQRIESSVPLTLNEIQADKDQLRAEFAMSTRRLEVSLEELKERAATQVIEINRRRDEVLSLESEQAEKSERINALQVQSDELRNEMRDREEKLSLSNANLASLEVRLEEKALEFENLERRHREMMEEFDEQKLELIAKGTKLDNVDDEVRDIKSRAKAMRDEAAKAEDSRKQAEAALKREKQRNEQLEGKLTRTQKTMTDLESRLERRDRDIAKLRDTNKDTSSRASSNENTLNKVQEENIRLKAEIAEATMRTEALLKDASGENVENAVAVFEKERKELREKLKAAEAEREELKIKLSAVELASGEDWETERRENSIVRERINDLAAKVTAMAAALEGPDSPINAALAEDEKETKAKKAHGTAAAKAKKDVATLADRIRALQEASE